MLGLCFALCFSLLLRNGCPLEVNDIVLVILSQENEYNIKLAENLQSSIRAQANSLDKGDPVIHITHIDFPHMGDWTVFPLIPKLEKLHSKSKPKWVFFAEDHTEIHLGKLIEVLSKYNSSDNVWVGHALYDSEATIIHHFAFYENPKIFKYPNVASGFAITVPLLKKLSKRLKKKGELNQDFSIDNGHELSLFIWDKGKGSILKHESAFCVEEESHCATYPLPFYPCEDPVPIESIYFAVKTCGKFHKDRVPVVKRTWARHAHHINFFSDVEDATIPTISLGIPNTENGHCGKTMAIIKYVRKELEEEPQINWVLLADDDTILSVSRLREVLTCYDPSIPLVLGERYGYNVNDPQGYNYVTGGGGIVLSRPLVEALSNPGVCECPSNSTPDDMFLGICITSLGVQVTHSPLFHQARPVDYATGYLKSQTPVSFHKHWLIDPFYVYEKWLSGSDYFRGEEREGIKHSEL